MRPANSIPINVIIKNINFAFSLSTSFFIRYHLILILLKCQGVKSQYFIMFHYLIMSTNFKSIIDIEFCKNLVKDCTISFLNL